MSLILLLRPLQAPVGPQPPNIVSFTPVSGPIGQVVVISGSNFTGATDVSFNGTPAVFNVDNDGQITATVPVGTTTGTISVTTAIGTGTSTDPFTITVPSTGLVQSGVKRRPVRIKYEDFQKNPEFLKSFLDLPVYQDDSLVKAEELRRIAKREAKMRLKAEAEERRLLALTSDSGKAAEIERVRKINNAIILMLLSEDLNDT